MIAGYRMRHIAARHVALPDEGSNLRGAVPEASDRNVVHASDSRHDLLRDAQERLPPLRPSNRRRSVDGAFSRPCCMSTLFLILPACPRRQARRPPPRRAIYSRWRCSSRSRRKARLVLASRAARAPHRGRRRQHCQRKCRSLWDTTPSDAPERPSSPHRSGPHRSAGGISRPRRGRRASNHCRLFISLLASHDTRACSYHRVEQERRARVLSSYTKWGMTASLRVVVCNAEP